MSSSLIEACVGTLFIPKSLGFEFVENRDDGHVYGLKEGFWYRYHPDRGEASQMASWERFEQDHMGINCQLCGAAANWQEAHSPRLVFCSKVCQLEYYHGK